MFIPRDVRPCYTLFIAMLLLLVLLIPVQGFGAHGLSMDGELRYPPDFERFAYTSADAKQGGRFTMHALASFDTLNPFTLKGLTADGLTSYVFETLTVPSLDEPFSQYGLIAEDIEPATDGLSVTFTINKNARFSDGTPVTAEDVLFSLETLKSEAAHPMYQFYYKDITGAEILSPLVIRFNFTTQNRELPLIAGQLPVLSKVFYTKYPFGGSAGDSVGSSDEGAMILPVGSGPYVVSKVNSGKSIEFRRNPDYWAKDLPVRKGMFNFDTIVIEYYRDQTVSLEAFKAGEFDFKHINLAKQWARDMVGKRFDSGELIKKTFAHKNNAGMQGFVFNTRKPIFAKRKVRQALGLAFDFEWTNSTLFYGQYTRDDSYFSNSELAAKGLPQGGELELLEPYRDQLPKEVFTEPLHAPDTIPPNSLRKNLRKAKQLLAEEGWNIKDGVLVNGEGTPFTFEIILISPSFERVMAGYVKNLQKLGIKAEYRTIDGALYVDRVKKFDFDMTPSVFPQSQSPGNEQRDFWGSAAAKRPGSRNIAGVDSPVVDALVDKIIYAGSREALITACHALDRVLWYGYYLVPNWYLPYYRFAYLSRLRSSETLPLYYAPTQLLDTWWLAP